MSSTTMSRDEVEVGWTFYILRKVNNEESELLGELGNPQAEEGWKYFATLTDASGGMSLATFQDQVLKVARRAIKETDAVSQLENFIKQQAASQLEMSSSDIDQKISKTSSKFVEKMLNSTPVFATALFRFFDIDGSGSISKQEIIAFAQIFKSVMELSGNSYGSSSKKNPVMTARKILSSIFRVFDENGNGNIEAIELSSIISSWIITVMNLGTDTITMLEDMIKGEAVKKAALELGMGLQSVSKSGSDINVDQTLKSLLESMPDEAPQTVAEGLTSSFTVLKEEIKVVVPDLEQRNSKAFDKYNTLVKAFTSEAESKKIPKDSIVKRSSEVFCDIIDIYLATDVLARGVDRPLTLLNNFLKDSTPISEGIARQYSVDLLDSLVSHLRSFFRSGGLQQTLLTFFDLIDVNNDAEWSKQELANLANIMSIITQDWSGPGLRSKFSDVIKSYLKLLDENSDGTISTDEIKKFTGKLFEFVFALHLLLIFILKESVLAVMLPAMKIALDLKTQVVGGSTESLSEADVMCIVAAIGMGSSG